jgi:hypothetical protein
MTKKTKFIPTLAVVKYTGPIGPGVATGANKKLWVVLGSRGLYSVPMKGKNGQMQPENVASPTNDCPWVEIQAIGREDFAVVPMASLKVVK